MNDCAAQDKPGKTGTAQGTGRATENITGTHVPGRIMSDMAAKKHGGVVMEKREMSEERYVKLSETHELREDIDREYEAGTWRNYIPDVSEKIRNRKVDVAEFRNRVRKNTLHIHEGRRRLRGEDKTSMYYRIENYQLRQRVRANHRTEKACIFHEKKLNTLMIIQAEYEAAKHK